jgi:hypothetical protein
MPMQLLQQYGWPVSVLLQNGRMQGTCCKWPESLCSILWQWGEAEITKQPVRRSQSFQTILLVGPGKDPMPRNTQPISFFGPLRQVGPLLIEFMHLRHGYGRVAPELRVPTEGHCGSIWLIVPSRSLVGYFGASPRRDRPDRESGRKLIPAETLGEDELGIADQLGQNRVTVRRILV